MIQRSTLSFLRKLARNNNRDWFAANKEDYLAAKADAEQLAMELMAGIREFDSSIGEMEPKDCMFRIYRDTRFAHDKTPYKTNIGVVIQKGGKKTPYSCYYAHIEPGSCILSGGLYMPAPEILKVVRQAIDANHEEFAKLIGERTFKKYFSQLVPDNKLTRVPAGFDKDSPAAELLKHRDYYVVRGVSDDEMCSPDYVKHALQAFRTLEPIHRFFNEAIDDM